MDIAVKVESLTFSYGDTPVLRDVSFALPQNSFLVVIGPNGGGKSTLIKLLLGLLPLQSGRISIFGQEPRQTRAVTGYVPQDSDQIKRFPVNVIDTVMMGFYRPDMGLPKAEILSRSMETLKLLEMEAYAERRLSSLSTGQRQRVLLARALATTPRLLILDEPTSGIDPSGQQIILDTLKAKAHEMTVIFISHDLSVIPGYATAVACINRTLHYHPAGQITDTLLTEAYGGIGQLKLVCHDCQDGQRHISEERP